MDILLMDGYRIMDRIRVLMDSFFIGIILIIKKVHVMDRLDGDDLILIRFRGYCFFMLRSCS